MEPPEEGRGEARRGGVQQQGHGGEIVEVLLCSGTPRTWRRLVHRTEAGGTREQATLTCLPAEGAPTRRTRGPKCRQREGPSRLVAQEHMPQRDDGDQDPAQEGTQAREGHRASGRARDIGRPRQDDQQQD